MKISHSSSVHLSSLVKVTDQTTGSLSGWNLYPKQEEVLNLILNNDRVIVLKIRQCGISTLAMFAVILHAICNPGSATAVVAHNHATSVKLIRDLSQMATSIGLEFVEASQKRLKLTNGSTIDAVTAGAKSGSAGRGATYSFIVCSEAAYWPDSGFSAMAAISATLTTNGKILIESTAAAGSNVFSSIWSDDNEYVKCFIGQESHPNYKADPNLIADETWLGLQKEYKFTDRSAAAWWNKKYLENGSDAPRMLREYPVLEEHAWAAASGRWINIDPTEAHFLPDTEFNKLRYFQPPNKDHTYVASIDTALGAGGDDTVVVVYDTNTNQIAASFCDNNTPIDAVVQMYSLLHKKYNPQYLYIESNGIGAATVILCRNQNYPVQEITTTNASRYQGMLWVRHQILAGMCSDDNLRNNCQSTIVLSSKSGMDRFSGKKDYLLALSFIGLRQAQWAAERDKPKAKVYGPNTFNPASIIRRKQ